MIFVFFSVLNDMLSNSLQFGCEGTNFAEKAVFPGASRPLKFCER